jgi:hypothetical protein
MRLHAHAKLVPCEAYGAIAQLGERRAGSAEVIGSIPISSTGGRRAPEDRLSRRYARRARPSGDEHSGGGPLPQLLGVLLGLIAPALVRCLVHPADGDEVVVELDGRVRVARAEDVLAEAATGGCGTCLAAFDLFFGRCGGNAELVSGIVFRLVANGNYQGFLLFRKYRAFDSRYVRM